MTLFTIFLEGLLSFLSPCVLPLLPLYMSYLAGEDKTIDEEGKIIYPKGKVFFSTVFFVLGISLTLLLLAFSTSSIGIFLNNYKEVIYLIGGTLLIIFGLHETGLINIDILNKEYKLKIDLHLENMNYIKAFLLGFVFSLGWSPCIGPMLSSALLMALTSSKAYLYIFSYGLGLTIPFLLTGLFTSTILNFISNHKNIMKKIMVISGIILILFGLYMIIESSKSISDLKKESEEVIEENDIFDKKFLNQYGKEVKLSDYKDDFIFVDYIATWCTYCKEEMEDFKKFKDNHPEIKCFYIITPKAEKNENAIKEFVEEYNVEIELLIDENADIYNYLGISSYPTKFIFAPNNEPLGYCLGALDYDGFEQLLTSAYKIYNEE